MPYGTIAFQRRSSTCTAGYASNVGFVRRSATSQELAGRPVHGPELAISYRAIGAAAAMPNPFERSIGLAQTQSIPSRRLLGRRRRRFGTSSRPPLVRPKH